MEKINPCRFCGSEPKQSKIGCGEGLDRDDSEVFILACCDELVEADSPETCVERWNAANS